MHHVETHDERYAQSRLLDRHLLQCPDLIDTLQVEDSPQLASLCQCSGLTVHGCPCVDVANRYQVQLSDLLFERHTRHEIVNVLVHFVVLSAGH